LIRDAVGDDKKLIGPLATLPKRVPITRAAFALHMVPTAHATELGWCIHDYATAPCELCNDCISCQEHVCIKGEKPKNQHTRELLQIELGLLRKARQDGAEGQYGAARWETHHQARVKILRTLVGLYDDPGIQQGAVIQLAKAPPEIE
jgi:hypothetical protein